MIAGQSGSSHLSPKSAGSQQFSFWESRHVGAASKSRRAGLVAGIRVRSQLKLSVSDTLEWKGEWGPVIAPDRFCG